MNTARNISLWAALCIIMALPLIAASFSPLLAYRDSIYIAACFAGIAGFGLLLMQPLLAGKFLPGLNARRSRQLHKYIGMALVLLVIAHIGGLWITSPPDVIDVLLFRSPTPFSLWGAAAMWAVFATACLAAFKRKLRPHMWRYAHMALGVLIAISTIAHALQIDGLMETISKVALCFFVSGATLIMAARVFTPRR